VSWAKAERVVAGDAERRWEAAKAGRGRRGATQLRARRRDV
jgi:hypothetical protein